MVCAALSYWAVSYTAIDLFFHRLHAAIGRPPRVLAEFVLLLAWNVIGLEDGPRLWAALDTPERGAAPAALALAPAPAAALAAPGLRLVGGNTPAELAQFFRRSFPGRAADGDTFERLVDEFQLRPADLLQMTEEQCQATLRDNDFPLLVVFTLQRRLREAYLGPHLGPPSSGGGVTGGG